MSFDEGLAIGLMLGRKGRTGGGDDIYITSYSASGITVSTISNRSAEALQTVDHTFSFILKEFKTVTTVKTSVKQHTRTWSKNIITSVSNGLGVTVWTLTPNNQGTIIAVYDANDNEILSGITNGDSVITNTPEGVALGYALAYNNEQSKLVEQLVQAYEDGITDQSNVGVDGEDTDVIVTDLEGNGARYYIARYYDASASSVRDLHYYNCEYIQILSVSDDGFPLKVFLKNVTFYSAKGFNKNGKVVANSEVECPNPTDMTKDYNTVFPGGVNTIRLSGTVYDADSNVYTGNMVFEK